MKNALLAGIRAFLDVKEEEKIASTETAKKISFLTLGRVFYGTMDWVVAAGLGSFSFWMQAQNFSGTKVFLGTWMYDFLFSAIFFFLSDMSGCDFTLGESLRRVADRVSREGFWGKLFSGMLLIGVSIKAIVWEGPEVMCFLFRKELKTRSNIWLGLFVMSAVQASFGTWLYTTGFELWKKYGSTVAGSHYILLGIATFIIFIIIVAILKKMGQLVISAIRFFLGASKKERRIFLAQCAVVALLIAVIVFKLFA
jgi:hypothetical protein